MGAVAAFHLTDYTSWKRVPTEKLFLAYHLIRGGIEEPADLKALTGCDLRNPAGVVEIAERLIYGPLAPSEPLRCVECGAMIVEVPCRVCRNRANFKRAAV